MADYLTIQEAVQEASQSAGCRFEQVPGKKIMFHARMSNGESVIMCTPQAKRQPQGFCWTDITEVQRNVLNSYDRAIVAFRLEGNRLTMCDWESLRNYLTYDCVKYNTSEGNHWKLHIYPDRIEVVGNPLKIKLVKHTSKEETIWDSHLKHDKRRFL